MTLICSACGISHEADAPVERDGWWITPWGPVKYRNRLTQIRPTPCVLLHTIAACDGPVSRVALIDRISETENDNLLSVQLSNLRRQLREKGLPVPFVNLWGTGKVLWLPT